MNLSWNFFSYSTVTGKEVHVLVSYINATILTCHVPDDNKNLARETVWMKDGLQLISSVPSSGKINDIHRVYDKESCISKNIS